LVVTFPDAPGCVTQANVDEDVVAKAAEALAGWIEASLDAGDVVSLPRARGRAPRGSRTVMVPVVPDAIALRLSVTHARAGSGLSVTRFARRLGISARLLRDLERGAAAPTRGTLKRVATALGDGAAPIVVRETARTSYTTPRRKPRSDTRNLA
jgi:hypothetical protein